ncbi:MAG: glycosyltransferase, partial [Actinobacteria bacterium]|nr:glycosyltransferase [Actinomycetota bacterium]
MSGQSALRGWLSRLRGIPARTERIDRVSQHLDSASHSLLATAGETTALLESLHARLQRIESEIAWARESQTAQLQPLLQRIEQQSELLAQLHSLQVSSDSLAQRRHSELSSLVSEAIHAAGVDLQATLAPSRDAALAELIAGLPAQTLRVEGLSVMIITWNHGAWLRRAIDSALQSLELLPDHLAGKILIFDDASNDETATLLESLNEDSRIRVIRSEVNLSLTRARNALLAVCPTTHAVILDADNRLSPAGVAQVYEVAATHRAAITFGHVLASTESEARIRAEWDAFAYAPSPWSLRNGYCFDSMAIIDVESVLNAGGYSTDPQLAGVADDLELLLRTLRQGKPVAFVPAVLGYYRKTLLRHSTTAADHKSVENRIARRYLYDDPDFEQFQLFGAHPASGILWASAAAQARVGVPLTTASQPVAPSPSGPRILVVAPGGVGNIGDDAISACAVRRIRRALPGCRIEMISDRGLPQMSGQPVAWIGTVLQAWTGLRPEELSSGADLSQGQVTAEQISAAQPTTPLLDLGSYQMAFFVGGGNLASAFAQNLLRPRAALSLCLSAAGVPVVVSGQGVGPCDAQELLLVQLMAGQAQAFGCRDAGSAKLIESQQPGKVELVGDDAMSAVRDAAAEADSQRLDQVLRSALVPDGEFLVFHARQASYVG